MDHIDWENPGQSNELFTPGVRSYALSFKQDTRVDVLAHSQGSVGHGAGVADMHLQVNGVSLSAHDQNFNNYDLNLTHSLIAGPGATVNIGMTTSNASATEDVGNSWLKVKLSRQDVHPQ